MAARNEVQHYLVLAYSDRDTTFLAVAESNPTGWFSGVLATEAAAQARAFTVETQNEQKPFASIPKRPKVGGKWGEVFSLPNVGAHVHLIHTGEVPSI